MSSVNIEEEWRKAVRIEGTPFTNHHTVPLSENLQTVQNGETDAKTVHSGTRRLDESELRKYRNLYRISRKNAAAREIPFRLSEGEFDRIVQRAGGRCELSGIAFRECREYRRNPWGASLDRIKSSGPYSYSNCRLVCVAANIALNVWGVDVLLSVADGIRNKLGQRASEIDSFLKRELLNLENTTAEAFEVSKRIAEIREQRRSNLERKTRAVRQKVLSGLRTSTDDAGLLIASQVAHLVGTSVCPGIIRTLYNSGNGPEATYLIIGDRPRLRWHIDAVTEWVSSGKAHEEIQALNPFMASSVRGIENFMLASSKYQVENRRSA